MSTNKRLKLLAAIQTASRQRDGGTYTPYMAGADVCLVIWEQGVEQETAAIIELDRKRITWNADATWHLELMRELGHLGMIEAAARASSPLFRAARAEVVGVGQ